MWCLKLFEEGHLVEAIGSVSYSELDSSRWQWATLSLSSPYSWVSHLKQNGISSASIQLARFKTCGLLSLPQDEITTQWSPFQNCYKLQSESQKVFYSLTDNSYQTKFQKWQQRWEQCITVQLTILKEIKLHIYTWCLIARKFYV